MELIDFLSILIFLMTVGVTFTEFRQKKATDILINIFISIIIFGISFYNLFVSKFDFQKVTTYFYILTILAGGAFVFAFLKNRKKFNQKNSLDNSDNNQDEK